MNNNKIFYSNRIKTEKQINMDKPSNTESVFIIFLYNLHFFYLVRTIVIK